MSLSKCPVEEASNGKRRAEHIHRLDEIEFRSLRAYIMHYKESGFFDKWARGSELGALAFGVLGVACSTMGVMLKKMPSLSLLPKQTRGPLTPLGIGFISVAVALEYGARGTSELSPSLALRAQKHVDAGAEMTRIYRLAKMYNKEFQALPPGFVQWNEAIERYKELLLMYETASKQSVIRETVYQKQDVNQVWNEGNRRSKQVTEYIKLEYPERSQ